MGAPVQAAVLLFQDEIYRLEYPADIRLFSTVCTIAYAWHPGPALTSELL
jgi:hypothetical protein